MRHRRVAVFSRRGSLAVAGGKLLFMQCSGWKLIIPEIPSGMTFGVDVARFCLSSISTPFKAHALVTSTYQSVVSSTTVSSYILVYEYVTRSFTGTPVTSNGIGYSMWTVSNITTITSALAVANPIIVAWQLEDLSSFPASYATSIANKIGVSMTPVASNTLTVPRETGAPPSSSPTPPTTSTPTLSTPAKVGIGIDSVAGALIIVATIVMLCMRARRKDAPAPRENGDTVPEMEDQDKTLAKRKWFLGGRWRSEAQSEGVRQELDSRAVHIVPGPPAELEAHVVPTSDSGAPATNTGRTGD
jgi:hypothetical protein